MEQDTKKERREEGRKGRQQEATRTGKGMNKQKLTVCGYKLTEFQMFSSCSILRKRIF